MLLWLSAVPARAAESRCLAEKRAVPRVAAAASYFIGTAGNPYAFPLFGETALNRRPWLGVSTDKQFLRRAQPQKTNGAAATYSRLRCVSRNSGASLKKRGPRTAFFSVATHSRRRVISAVALNLSEACSHRKEAEIYTAQENVRRGRDSHKRRIPHERA